MIVDEAMARRVWPGHDALGQCLRIWKPTNVCTTVVGIVANTHLSDVIADAAIAYYVPVDQDPFPGAAPSAVVIRTPPERAGAVSIEARRILGEQFPGAEPAIRAMTDVLAPQYRPFRLGAVLFTSFGVLALLVSGVGVYSTLSYTFSQRTHEIGVRMALGARVADVVQLVVREGLRVIVIGVAAGVLIALASGQVIASLLYGVSARDPWIIGGSASVLLAIAIVAALVPARRAARVDPVLALRAEG
jgi:hypothetical protein